MLTYAAAKSETEFQICPSAEHYFTTSTCLSTWLDSLKTLLRT